MPEEEVHFLHATDPAAWAQAKAALSALAGREVEDGGLVEAVRSVREVNGRKSSLQALRLAAERLATEDLWGTTRRLAALAAQAPELFPEGVRQLLQGQQGRVLLTRRQCAALLALELFGAMPDVEQQGMQAAGQRLEMPEFSLDYILSRDPPKAACLLSYFLQVLAVGQESQLDEVVSFSRRVQADVPTADFWRSLDAPLLPLLVREGCIEESAGNLQADFANRYLGGGVMHGGNVQEEIRFSVCPECLVGLLFCEAMLDNEAIFIAGARQYSKYTGYGGSFEYVGPYDGSSSPAADALGRVGPHIVAFDALEFPGKAQYCEELVLRELAKAYVACQGDFDEEPRLQGFATGNWGCGVFGGDPQLKSLVQWLAASAAGRQLVYFPFGDFRVSRLEEVASAAVASGARCCDLFELLLEHEPLRVFDGVLGRVAAAAGGT